jgi:UDP-N-acetylglucosamine 2-epimerase (non-hydrolysing)
VRPEVFVVLGDRWELLYAVPPVVLAGVPVVHLHGGEVTEGAVDDRVRHAITKLADLHCVSTTEAAARVRQLGEPADRVVITGAPALDRLADVSPATDEQLATLLGAALVRPFALVTYHPATAGGPDPATGARNVLAAVAERAGSALVTHPGLDAGREAVLAEITHAVQAHPAFAEVAALGANYLPVLAAADVVVGNSSSGIFEAASFGVPVVDVGDRQRGRARAGNVVHAAEDREAIAAAIGRCLDPQFRAAAREVRNGYGDGQAAPRIVEVIRRGAQGGLARKPFLDLPDLQPAARG